MKEYGVQECWTNFSVTRPVSSRYSVPLFCLVSDDNVVLDVVREEKLIVSNTKEHKWRDMMVDWKEAKFRSTAAFTESLVSPVLRYYLLYASQELTCCGAVAESQAWISI